MMENKGFLPISLTTPPTLDNDLALRIGQKKMDSYAFAEPFPHTIIDHFLPLEIAEKILAHFPQDKKLHDKVYEKGYGGTHKRQISPSDCDDYIRSVFYFFNSASFLQAIEGITNIKGLLPDPYFTGGGFHEISAGGLLGIHADFRVNENLQLLRRVNVLLYLNKDWQEDWGGKLELWDKEMQFKVKEIAPIFNRCVIFNTDANSFHGHPEPLKTPPNITRKSIALYYYTALPIENDTGESRHTLYVARPNDTKKNINEAKKLAKSRDKRAKKRLDSQNPGGFLQRIKSKIGNWL